MKNSSDEPEKKIQRNCVVLIFFNCVALEKKNTTRKCVLQYWGTRRKKVPLENALHKALE